MARCGWKYLRLNEQIREGRVGRFRRRVAQDHLGVAGQFNGPTFPALVGDGHSPQLDVVLGRNADLGVNLEVVVAPPKLGTWACEKIAS